MEDVTIPTPKKVNNGSLKDEEIKEALIKYAGHQAKAAAALGYTRAYVCQRINQSEYLKRAYDDIRETWIDNAEEGLSDLIKEKEFNAICFFLKTIGKKRGYIEGNANGAVSPELLELFHKFMSQPWLKPNDSPTIRPEAD